MQITAKEMGYTNRDCIYLHDAVEGVLDAITQDREISLGS